MTRAEDFGAKRIVQEDEQGPRRKSKLAGVAMSPRKSAANRLLLHLPTAILARVLRENSTPTIFRKSYSSASRSARPLPHPRSTKVKRREIFVDVRQRGAKNVGINRLIIFGVRAKAATMDHPGGVASRQNVVRMFFRDEFLAKPPDEVPESHRPYLPRTPCSSSDPGILGRGRPCPSSRRRW